MSEKVDARGLSCPQPAILTKSALETTDLGEVTVLVDTMTQVQNCARTAENAGWQAEYEEKEGAFEVRLTK
ncbi:MAG: sulfurtransferase TusA family protein [Phycisphaerales bacterium]|nr:MAG: sulfurtransferase TusA family protein [Phycisphaerales bacterium]